MISEDGVETPLSRICNPEWLCANSASYELDLADHRAYSAAVKRYIISKRSFANRAIQRIVRFFLGAVSLTAYFIALTYFVTPRYFDPPQPRLLAGAVLGFFLTIGILLTSVLINHWLTHTPDLNWLLRTIHIRAEADNIWAYNGTFSVIYSPQSFVDVVQIDNAVLAFTNMTQAQWFPREKLLKSEQGKAVLDWFATRWPERVAPSSASLAPFTRHAERSILRTWLQAILVLILLSAATSLLFSRWS